MLFIDQVKKIYSPLVIKCGINCQCGHWMAFVLSQRMVGLRTGGKYKVDVK